MKKLLLIFVTVFTLFVTVTNANATEYHFSVTTREIAANGTFQFMLSASGTFYVDCGTGGTLSSDDSTANAMISGGTITKNDTTNYTFKCTYSTSGTKTIQFGGEATGYNMAYNIAAIGFNITSDNNDTNARLISSISGNLSTIFPCLGSSSGQIPRFYGTFWTCRNLQSVPDTLFSDYSGNLAGAYYMFARTFYVSGLKSIPENLFSGITGGGPGMFTETFAWSGVFTSIPENLFSGITNGANSMFFETFRGCSGITSIPENLFSGITNGANSMFAETFSFCTNVTSLPEHLFSNITTSAEYMFRDTFDHSGITGYIPSTLFAGLIANNSPYTTGMMSGVFGNTSLATSCPNGTIQVTTGYEQYWETGNGIAVSCEPNTLNVNWYNESTQLSVGSESQSCVYGDYITVPTVSATKPGYHFGGWKVKQ